LLNQPASVLRTGAVATEALSAARQASSLLNQPASVLRTGAVATEALSAARQASALLNQPASVLRTGAVATEALSAARQASTLLNQPTTASEILRQARQASNPLYHPSTLRTGDKLTEALRTSRAIGQTPRAPQPSAPPAEPPSRRLVRAGAESRPVSGGSTAPQVIRTVADLGQQVRAARRAMKLNQQRFGDLAGVGRRFVSELEAGKPSLEMGRVLACCAAAGVDVLAQPRR
jgi:y4mF family transcriptional regulator